ncbi:MAG: IMP dehydrogenase, partial [Desulfovibrionaceae bacterium]|nr:IMP dehydrogenase [Desulfovibrionaceae bacterium]
MLENRGKALTFDDILLIPSYSEVTPDMVDVSTWLTPDIPLKSPLLSAAMDTVTKPNTGVSDSRNMAISMARMGGIGVIHKNMSIEKQRLEVEKVKKSESGMILDPVTISPDSTVREALDLMHDFSISGLPVVEHDELVGILTNRDVRFVEDGNKVLVKDMMTSGNLVTVPMGTSLDEAKRHLHEHRIEKLLVVDENKRLKGLITIKDIDKVQKYPNACKDDRGRLRVAAAIGVTADTLARTEALIAGGVDALVMDSAHGHSANILRTIREVKSAFPNCQL